MEMDNYVSLILPQEYGDGQLRIHGIHSSVLLQLKVYHTYFLSHLSKRDAVVSQNFFIIAIFNETYYTRTL